MAISYGVHLPAGSDLPALLETVRAARLLGFDTVAATDVGEEGPCVLASVAMACGDMTLMTAPALPVVRGPLATARSMAMLGRIAPGRVITALGPGTSEREFAGAGVRFAERWERFDEAARLVRALLRGELEPAGRFYDAPLDLTLSAPGDTPPTVWLASGADPAELRRVARLGDGWLAQDLTPPDYAAARAVLDRELRAAGRDPGAFPDAVAGVGLGPASLLAAYEEAGARRVLVSPGAVAPRAALERFGAQVLGGFSERLAA